MEKYKICPTCGTRNAPTMIECVKCETDLTSVPIGELITKDSTDRVSSESKEISSVCEVKKMVRICECGARNPASARKCLECGEDISDIMPVQDTVAEKDCKLHFILSSLDGTYAFELSQNLTIAGRENAMKEYLATKSFVSRKHAEFLIEADKIWIKNHSNTNHTYVNNEKLKDNEYFELHDGDLVGLGGKEINGLMQNEAAYFRVRIGICI